MTDTETEVPTTVKVGDAVIAVSSGDDIYTYGGYDEARGGMESRSYDMRYGSRTTLRTSPERIAPAALLPTIPAKDPRVVPVKRTTRDARAAGHYGRGSWSYTIPGVDFPLWANTRTEALAEGAQRLAIAAWHDREDTSVDLTEPTE